MRHKLAVTAAAAFALLLLLPAGNMSAGGTLQPGPEPPKVQSAARDRAAGDGHARVIVELTLTTGRHVAEGLLRNADAIAQRNASAAASSQLLLRLPAGGGRLV